MKITKNFHHFFYFNHFICFAIISILLTSCGGSDDGTNATQNPCLILNCQNESLTMATQYFPLAIGNIWQDYVSVTESDGNAYTEYTYRNSNKIVTFNNSHVYNVKNDINTPDGENENFFYSKWDDGIYFHGISDPNADNQGVSVALTYTPPVLHLKSTFDVTDTWSTTTDSIYEENGSVIETYTETFNYSVMTTEDVTVPAGTFQNCYKISIEIISSNLGSNENMTIWLAENVGVVKTVSDTIDFDYTKVLQYADIDGMEYGSEF